jgi:hypothetical protein
MSIGATTALSGRFTDVTATTGNVVIGTSGQGVDFAATPGTGTSELLNDYEEGTWSPVASPETGSLTSYTSSGNYTKIGRQVQVQGVVTVTSLGTAGGEFYIDGLPFNASSSISQMVGLARDAGVSGALGQVYVRTSTQLALQTVSGTAGVTVWFANASWRFNLTYFV